MGLFLHLSCLQWQLHSFVLVLLDDYWILIKLCFSFILGQNYNRDLFLFLYILLLIVSAITSLKKHNDKSAFSGKSILYLNRHQTEEWKGYMQVIYLVTKSMLNFLHSIWNAYMVSWVMSCPVSGSFFECQIESSGKVVFVLPNFFV